MPTIKNLECLFSQGKITRREFIARASALGLTVALSPVLFSGKVLAAEPKKGGRLRIGTTGMATSDILDPALQANVGITTFAYGQLYDTLVEIDADSQPAPSLAKNWEPSPDAKTWTFNLRKGVEFHNGKSMTADDVFFSINHHRGKDSKSAAKSIVASIKNIKTDGKYRVIYTLDAGNADFPYVMSDYHLCIVPKGTKNFEKGIGTGPYMLDAFIAGVRGLTKRFPNYYRSDRGHFEEVETIVIADVNSRTTALKTGQVDVINRCDLKTVHLLGKMPGIQIVRTNGTKHYTLPMLTDVAPYNNNDVRLGLKYAIDRKMVLDRILRGYGVIGNDHPIAPSNRYFAKEIPQREYDPEKAKYHLKKAGMLDHTFNLHTSDAAYAGAVDTAVLYSECAAKAGIKIKLVQEPADGYWSNVWMKKPWCFCFWGGRPTEDWMFSTTYASGASWNDTHWNHDKFNKLLVAARAELDEAKRREMYVEMQRIVRDEGGAVIPLFASDLHGATKRLAFNKVAANFEFDGWRVAQRWWFA